MPKLIVLSIVFMSAAVPIYMSTRAAPRRALRIMQWTVVAFIVVWAWMCITLYPQLVPLD